MPLYDQQTSLQNQGRFSPGVNYYAGIRKPNQPNPHLEKANASFNIDLSRIGDAMIQAQDNEYKLQASILQSENAMREAEKERQLKHEQMHLEDQRYRWGKLGDWEIDREKLNVEWYKAQQTKAASQKETYIAQAQQALLADPKFAQLMADVQNGDIGNLERSQRLNELLLTHSRAFPNVKPSDLTGVLGTLGITSGIDSDIKARQEIAKEQQKKQIEADTSLGGILNPGASEAEKASLGAELRGSIERIDAAKRVMNDPNSPQLYREMAERQMNKDTDTVINLTLSNMVDNYMNYARDMDNPVESLEAFKQTAANTLSQQFGIDLHVARARVDAVMELKGGNSTAKEIQRYNKENAEYYKNAKDTLYDSFKYFSSINSPMLKAYMAYPELFQYLPNTVKDSLGRYLSTMLYAGVQSNYTWKGVDGTVYNGFNIFAGGRSDQVPNENAAKVAKEMGLTPGDAVYYFADQMLKNTPAAVRGNRMSPADAADVTAKNVSTLTGNPNLNGSVYNMKPENVVQIMDNVVTCVDNGNCTPEKLREIADSIPNTSPQEKERLYRLANNLAGWYKLSKVLDGKTKQMTFTQAYQYMIPDYFKYLKETQMYYTIKDNDVYIDYTQNGLIKVGDDELLKRASYVAHEMSRAGLTLEEKLEVYRSMFPNLIENTNPDAASQWLKRTMAFLQDVTIGTGAKDDTALAKLLSDISKGGKRDIIFKPKTSERPVTAEGTTEITPEMRDNYMMNQAYENLTRPKEDQTTSQSAWIDTSTGESVGVSPSEGWTQEGDYAYKFEGDYLNIQIGNDLLIVKTSKSPEEIIADFENDPDSLKDYEYIRHLKRVGDRVLEVKI